MAYTANTWHDGDVITAAKLNALEQGVAEGGSIGETGAAGKDGIDGAKGDTGAPGVGIQSIDFTTTDGKITAVKVTGTDGNNIPATVTETPAAD